MTLPHNREAEEAVLGAVFLNPLVLFELQFLKPQDFFIQRFGWVWDAFLQLSERHEDITFLTVGAVLEHSGQLKEFGGNSELIRLSNAPSSFGAASHAQLVQKCAMRRQIIAAASVLANKASQDNADPRAIIVEGRTKLDGITDLSEHKLIEFGQLLGDTFSAVEARAKDPKEVWGLRTGLAQFDKKTGGIQIGELTYMMGAPGRGKTWSLLGWGFEFGTQAPGAWISLEMRKLAVGRRILSGISGVSTRSMKSGFMQDGDWPKLTKAIEGYGKLPIWFDDSPYDTEKLRSMLIWAKQEKGIKWFILDYALLLLDRGESETERTTMVSSSLKNMVQELDLAGVVIQSVNKIGMNEKGEPDMTDMRGSGQGIHDADLQLSLTEVPKTDTRFTPQEKEKMVTLWVTKARELEQSRFSIALCRKGFSPFWTEASTMREPEMAYRKDYE